MKTTEGFAKSYLVRPMVSLPDISSVFILTPDRVHSGVDNIWSNGVNVDSARKALVAAGDSMLKTTSKRDTLAKVPLRRDSALKVPASGSREFHSHALADGRVRAARGAALHAASRARMARVDRLSRDRA